jgi:TetR/AcrR family fatty acid metabolism transcriptional regulator
LTERSTGLEEKRRLILDAAVRVFAHRGFHTSRVGDIAEEAGVAHGLLYHYFESKDQLLDTVFRENWSVLVDRIRAVEETDEPAADQLRHVAAILLRTWRHEPDVVRVVVREIARSPEVQQRIGELVTPIASIRRIVERGQARGEFRADLDPSLAATIFYGAVDAVLTGWVLGTRQDGDEEIAAAEQTLVDVVIGGFRAPSSPGDQPDRGR